MKNFKIVLAFHKEIVPEESWFERIKSKAIQWWTKSEYYHVEFIYNNIWYSMDPDGLTKIPLKPLKSKYVYIEIEKEITDQQYRIITEFLEKDFGYDWKGIFLSQFFNFGIENRSKWFCSEYIAIILQIMTIEEIIFYKPNKVSPGLLYNLIMKYKENANETKIQYTIKRNTNESNV